MPVKKRLAKKPAKSLYKKISHLALKTKRHISKSTSKAKAHVSKKLKRPKKIYLKFKKSASEPVRLFKLVLTHPLPPNTSLMALSLAVIIGLSIIISIALKHKPVVAENLLRYNPSSKAKIADYPKFHPIEPKVLGETIP